jgi:hypothetical protein
MFGPGVIPLLTDTFRTAAYAARAPKTANLRLSAKRRAQAAKSRVKRIMIPMLRRAL